MNQKNLSIFVFCLFSLVGSVFFWQTHKNSQIQALLKSAKSSDIESFILNNGNKIISHDSNMIKQFLVASQDMQSYVPNRDRENHPFTLSIMPLDVHIRFYVTPAQPDYLIGNLGYATENSWTNYGNFKSQKLLHWAEKFIESLSPQPNGYTAINDFDILG